MSWNADTMKRHRSGLSAAGVHAVAVRRLATSFVPGCPKRAGLLAAADRPVTSDWQVPH
jgi:hypothetical protein